MTEFVNIEITLASLAFTQWLRPMTPPWVQTLLFGLGFAIFEFCLKPVLS